MRFHCTFFLEIFLFIEEKSIGVLLGLLLGHECKERHLSLDGGGGSLLAARSSLLGQTYRLATSKEA